MKRLMKLLGGGVLVAAMLGAGCSKDDSRQTPGKQPEKQQKTKPAKPDEPTKTRAKPDKPVKTAQVAANTMKQVTLAISGMT